MNPPGGNCATTARCSLASVISSIPANLPSGNLPISCSQRVHVKRAAAFEWGVNHSRDNTSDHEPVSTRKQREPVRSACVSCRKRKTKCSGQRPVCQYCSRSNIECSWQTIDGLTWAADLKAKVVEAAERVDDLDVLISAMKFGTDESSTMLLAQLRLGIGIKALAQSIRFGYHTAPVNVVGLSRTSSLKYIPRGLLRL
jgi:hypothetical protein